MFQTQSHPHPHSRAVSLNDLVLSPLNVRKTPPSAAEQEELKASLLAHGLLENLVVRAADDGRFEVLAGGRRLAALQALAAEGHIPADCPVRCLIHDGDPGEVSLAENVVRLSMHALDQFEAFAALADKGQSVAEIASRFGHSETLVRQRLRLGRVAPEIREAYRDDEITLEALMAFAVTEDHGQQLSVWNEVKDGYIHASHVKRLLTDEKIAATSKLVRFVGLEAYQAAGGAITRDLFAEGDAGVWLEDRALIERLAQAKLDTAARDLKQAEGWKWVQAAADLPWDLIQKCQTVYPQAQEPTPEQAAELERLQKGLEIYEPSTPTAASVPRMKKRSRSSKRAMAKSKTPCAPTPPKTWRGPGRLSPSTTMASCPSAGGWSVPRTGLPKRPPWVMGRLARRTTAPNWRRISARSVCKSLRRIWRGTSTARLI